MSSEVHRVASATRAEATAVPRLSSAIRKRPTSRMKTGHHVGQSNCHSAIRNLRFAIQRKASGVHFPDERIEYSTFERGLEREDIEVVTGHYRGGHASAQVLAGPLRFTPQGRVYRFEGEAAVGRLLAGMTGVATFGTSPTGTGHILRRDYRLEIAAA